MSSARVDSKKSPGRRTSTKQYGRLQWDPDERQSRPDVDDRPPIRGRIRARAAMVPHTWAEEGHLHRTLGSPQAFTSHDGAKTVRHRVVHPHLDRPSSASTRRRGGVDLLEHGDISRNDQRSGTGALDLLGCASKPA